MLRSLTKKFGWVVKSIEDTTNPADLKIGELQAKLEAKEVRINLLDGKAEEDQALFAGKGKGKKGSKNNKQPVKDWSKGKGGNPKVREIPPRKILKIIKKRISQRYSVIGVTTLGIMPQSVPPERHSNLRNQKMRPMWPKKKILILILKQKSSGNGVETKELFLKITGQVVINVRSEAPRRI